MSNVAILKNQDVAERFCYFMRAKGLNNQSFLDAVDQAITASSLFSLLNGHRRPSKSLAVLIEKLWGYRAQYLLEGVGELWVESRLDESLELSLDEREVLAFMRQSVAQAKEMKLAMEKSRLWAQLYQRIQACLQCLQQCAQSDDPLEQALYPELLEIVFNDCQRSADIFQRYSEYYHKRRVHRLNGAFIQRFLQEIPQYMLVPEDYLQLKSLMAPIIERSRRTEVVLNDSIANLKQSLANACEQAIPNAASLQRNLEIEVEPIINTLAVLGESIKGEAGDVYQERIRESIEALQQFAQPSLTLWPDLQTRVLALLERFDVEAQYVPIRSIQDLGAS